MYADILRRIAGVEVFPIVSLLLFVTVFTVVLVWTARLDATRLNRAASMPLDGDEAHDHTIPGGTDPRSHS